MGRRDWTFRGLFGRIVGGLLTGYLIGMIAGMTLVALVGMLLLFLGMVFPSILPQGNSVINFFTGPAMQTNMATVGKITGQCLALTLGMVWPTGYYLEPNRATRVAPDEV